MEIKVLFFGIAADLTNKSEINLPIKAPISITAFKEQILKTEPNLKNLQTYSLAINENYANEKDCIQPNDVVAIIPPVSGG